MAEPVEDIPSFDPTMKKKKKKKKPTGEDDQNVPADDAVADSTEAAPSDSGAASEASKENADADAEEDDAEIDFSAKKKKKKKPAKEAPVEESPEAGDAGDAGDADENQEQGDKDAGSDGEEDGDGEEDPSQGWLDSDRDYTYNELLSRAFSILDGNNPDSSRAKRSRMVMKPPSVFREGTKKTVWANFQEICKLMHRSTDHVMAFSLTELGTSGSVDGSYRLVIKGRFTPKQIESVIKHYITEYVTCRTCKSPETNLKKENRLYFVQCRSCGSTRSVAAIKYGFQAQVGKRKKT